jgi:hypothetical protein
MISIEEFVNKTHDVQSEKEIRRKAQLASNEIQTNENKWQTIKR